MFAHFSSMLGLEIKWVCLALKIFDQYWMRRWPVGPRLELVDVRTISFIGFRGNFCSLYVASQTWNFAGSQNVATKSKRS